MNMERKRLIIWNVVSVAFLVAFFLLLSNINTSGMKAFDEAVYNSLYKASWLTSLMKVITHLGDGATLVGIALLSFFVLRDKFNAIAISLDLSLISLVNHTLKNVIKRPRPDGFRLILIDGYSFPSGHSATSFAFYGFLIYLIIKNSRNKIVKVVTVVTLAAVILGVGISRVYLGVHYASDVIGGFLFAAFFTMIFISFIENATSKKL